MSYKEDVRKEERGRKRRKRRKPKNRKSQDEWRLIKKRKEIKRIKD